MLVALTLAAVAATLGPVLVGALAPAVLGEAAAFVASRVLPAVAYAAMPPVTPSVLMNERRPTVVFVPMIS